MWSQEISAEASTDLLKFSVAAFLWALPESALSVMATPSSPFLPASPAPCSGFPPFSNSTAVAPAVGLGGREPGRQAQWAVQGGGRSSWHHHPPLCSVALLPPPLPAHFSRAFSLWKPQRANRPWVGPAGWWAWPQPPGTMGMGTQSCQAEGQAVVCLPSASLPRLQEATPYLYVPSEFPRLQRNY